MRYYLTQDHFHYDDSGYYGYILFSGTNAELRDLLKALGRGEKPHGFGWHRWGRSFRPANDGVVYEFYIRLRSKSGAKPTQEEVDAFLRGALPPATAVKTQTPPTTTSAPTDNNPPQWASQLLTSVTELQQQNIETLTRKMSEELLQLRSEVGEFSALQGEIRRLEANLEQTRAELAEKEADLEAKEEEIETLRDAPRAASYDKQMQEERDKAEKAANRLRDEIKQLRAEKNDRISSLKASLKEAEEDRDNWKQQFDDISESFVEPKVDEDDIADEDGNFENDLISIVEGAFPQLEMLHKSLDRLPRVPNFRPIMKLLHDVHARKLRGERVATTNWSEARFSKSWRLYFCNKSSLPNGKVLVIIGDKNSQGEDLRWLKANPPESCL